MTYAQLQLATEITEEIRDIEICLKSNVKIDFLYKEGDTTYSTCLHGNLKDRAIDMIKLLLKERLEQLNNQFNEL